MKMTTEKRAIDKIYRRRDRYEIPDWQRGEVWDITKKQQLIDSIIRGWKLPKFYFLKISDTEFEVVDGQQRLSAIFEFCSNDFSIITEPAKGVSGKKYSELPQPISDLFDDFEIEYDLIEDASDEEVKDFFQRLQAGLPLTSSEKLNAVHSKLRDFCRKQAKHPFFKETVHIIDSRYSHFDIVSKVASIEIEGLDTGVRYDDIKAVFDANNNFSPSSAVAKRIIKALDFLHEAFKSHSETLRTRTVVQSLITLTCKLVATNNYKGLERDIREFFELFVSALARQIELGQSASDSDYLIFQRSVNANVKGGAKTRHEILLRKLLQMSPKIADIFDPSIVAESGVSGRINGLCESIAELIEIANRKHAATTGDDLFKATSKTAQALVRIRKPIKDLKGYKMLIDDLYFLFRESVGSRIGGVWPTSFADVNDLRTDLRHDVDHGDAGKVRAKRKRAGTTFGKYAGGGIPDTIEPLKFPLVQSNILGAIEGDLRGILAKMP